MPLDVLLLLILAAGSYWDVLVFVYACLFALADLALAGGVAAYAWARLTPP